MFASVTSFCWFTVFLLRTSNPFGGSAESWVIQQAQYDLWQAMQGADKIKRQVRAFASIIIKP